MSPVSGSDVDFRLRRAREDMQTIPPGDPDAWMALARHRPGVLVPGLSPLESAVMTTVWNAGEPLTVRGCRDRLDYKATHGEPPTYSTVMTVMVILCRKGLLWRAKDLGAGHPRALWHQPRVTREDYLAGVIGLALCCTTNPPALLRRAAEMAPASSAGRHEQTGWFTVDDEHRRDGVVELGWFQRLQALEDAIAYRRARVAAPCPDCGAAMTGGRCDDHACDLDLIAGYQRAADVVCGWIDARHAGIARSMRPRTGHPRA